MRASALPAILAAVMALHVSAREARLTCDAPVFQFGSVPNTQIVCHAFVLRNTGDATATITRVHSTCGCTTVQPNHKALPPGATETMEVRFNPKGRHGPQNRPIFVSWNSTNSQPLRLSLTGMVFEVVACEPTLARFGPVPATGVVEKVVRIYDPSSNSAFRITGITIPHASFVNRIETITEGHDYRLTITSRGPRPEGLMASTAATVTTDNPEHVVVRIPISMYVPGKAGATEPPLHPGPELDDEQQDQDQAAPDEIDLPTRR